MSTGLSTGVTWRARWAVEVGGARWHRRGGRRRGGIDVAVGNVAAVVVIPHLAGFVMGTEKKRGGFTHLALPCGTRWWWLTTTVVVVVGTRLVGGGGGKGTANDRLC